MKIRTSATAVVTAAALGMALAPTAALAHDGGHPFKNCTAAYDAGYSNIAEGDSHYGRHLDRDGDGIGCDKPPAGFVPAKDRDKGDESGTGTGDAAGETPAKTGGDLAETGGSSATPYIAAGGGLVLAAGAVVLVATRRRRAES
ncbi:excalibur calcium-binding domain-containing protein [Streptomyces sp. WMMB 322]|uniref:excalibur calcium-binding domain-containing protein n=1 Tax=Streptomyces sp. WMMB 322 TaxID=1286821 RepID=UPI0006E2C31F|nr:excalibur calcium-binding domain-containing protein [Streptomyces sp. WMMB 322]SCK19811.1 LPXTG-motif cell wall anchor domain-containing protein [Streptomyces sp. WMMB 322]